ncbi:MAG TPA: DUF6152 family protein, partial [Gammaproteobacteria bacterium]|nr:DUF6152 family protein [Gammaproteobacteria bacterium]
HSYVQMMAKDEQGVMRQWSVEWGALARLTTQGIKRNTFKYGDHVVVTGFLSRTPGEYRVRLNTIYRPSDGLRWGTKPGETVR